MDRLADAAHPDQADSRQCDVDSMRRDAHHTTPNVADERPSRPQLDQQRTSVPRAVGDEDRRARGPYLASLGVASDRFASLEAGPRMHQELFDVAIWSAAEAAGNRHAECRARHSTSDQRIAERD